MSLTLPPQFNNLFLRNKLLLLLLLTLGLQAHAQYKKDSLWAVWKNPAMADTFRLQAIGKLCSNFYWDTKPDSAILLADLAYDLAKKKNMKRYMGVALLKKSGAYIVKGDYAKNLDYIRQGLVLFREINYEAGIATCLNNMGMNYMETNNPVQAVHYFYEALKVFEKTDDQLAMAKATSNIALSYLAAGKTDSALKIFKQSLKLCESVGHKRGMAQALGHLSSLFLEASKTDEAFRYEERAMALYLELSDESGLAESYHSMANIYLNRKDYKQAQAYISKFLAICRGRKHAVGISSGLLLLSKLSRATGQPDSALAQAKAGLGIIHYRHEPGLTYELAQVAAGLLEQKKNYKEALAMHKLYVKERDSSNNMSVKNAVYQEHLKYEFEKKELVAKAGHEKKLNAISAEAERKDFRKNLWLTASAALLLMLLLSAYFVYQQYRQKNIIASQKNNLLKQQLLVSQMSPHFIFNSLNAVQNFIFKQDSYHAGIYLKQFSELIRMILDFSRKELISLDEEFNFLKNYMELQKLRFDHKLNYEISIDPKLDTGMVLIPPMLAQPFIENAIEHGIFYKNGEGFLSVRISLKGTTIVYEIEDDGIGLGESLKIKKGLSAKHKSLAIEITRERIEAMNLRNHTDFNIEITDKGLVKKETTGVYVKFATPFLTL